MSSNNYKVAGKKMTSRFYMSNRELRGMAKAEAQFSQPSESTRRLKYSTRRLAKKCKHLHWVDTGYGGPDSGAMEGHCKDCGFSMHEVLY